MGAHVSPRELSDPDNLLLLSYPFGSGSNASSRGTLRLVLFGKDTENIFSPFYKLFVPREQESWTAPKTAPICISLYIFKEWLVLWKELTSWLVKINVCWLYQKVHSAQWFTIPGNKLLAPETDPPDPCEMSCLQTHQENVKWQESQGFNDTTP